MLILTHVGVDLPIYLEIFLKQLRDFNPNLDILFLVNHININNDIFIKFNVKTYPIEELHNNKINLFIQKFRMGDSSSHQKKIIYGGADYWCVAATRLFYLSEYVKRFNINSFFHFENDIMIYENIDKIKDIIKSNKLYENCIAITRGTKNKIMTGFMYVDNSLLLSNMLDEITLYLDNRNNLMNSGIDHINEMGLLHMYQLNNSNILKHLPTFPNNKISEDFNFFNSLFDPATYGQILDGTPGDPGVSILPDSYISDEFLLDNSLKIIFDVVDGKNMPFLVINNKKIKINSLHIHSKRMEKFKS
jgi:hypothetical protein